MGTSTDQVRLWQLISPLSPVGAYHHSQGLEQAVEAGWVTDEETALAWIQGLLGRSIANLDLPIVARARDSMAVPATSPACCAGMRCAGLAGKPANCAPKSAIWAPR